MTLVEINRKNYNFNEKQLNYLKSEVTKVVKEGFETILAVFILGTYIGFITPKILEEILKIR